MPCPEEVAVIVATTAIAISKNLSATDTALLAAVFGQLSNTLVTLSTMKARCEIVTPPFPDIYP
ncbi:hypothetical protein U6B65_12850 [Oscillospiraceae bacterium MB08-C2-2]|nr:hypothetical protein U6B65_12850 [Oscillospiraceae bacterium MB08-C2-2]